MRRIPKKHLENAARAFLRRKYIRTAPNFYRGASHYLSVFVSQRLKGRALADFDIGTAKELEAALLADAVHGRAAAFAECRYGAFFLSAPDIARIEGMSWERMSAHLERDPDYASNIQIWWIEAAARAIVYAYRNLRSGLSGSMDPRSNRRI